MERLVATLRDLWPDEDEARRIYDGDADCDDDSEATDCMSQMRRNVPGVYASRAVLPPSDIGQAVTHGVVELCSQGVVHGDLKGNNIGFGGDGRLVFLDFGEARQLAAVTGEELVRLAAAASLYQLGTWLPLRLSVDSGKQWTFASTAQELLRGYRIREMAPMAASFVRRTLLDEAPRDRLAAGARAHLESYGKGGGAGATAEDEK